jgi:uncharacterized membrane protein
MELTGTRRLFRFRSKPDLTPLHIATGNTRVTSIDFLRGLVMIVMALDHVRDYFHAGAFVFDPTDLTQTNVPLFFTRFITHFCAPVFMLLSGTSAYIVGKRKGKKALTRFLFTRGLWLIFLELTIVNFGWFFDFSYANTGTLVIWALGCSMIGLAGLIHLPKAITLAFSLMLIFGHNLLDSIHFNNGFGQYIWAILHEAKPFFFKDIAWFALYPLIPWVGVMSLGYCLGTFYETTYSPQKRRRQLLWYGIAATLLFIALRFTNWYGDPFLWSGQSRGETFTVLSFLNLNKYPPSLLYLLVTLGPALIFLALTEKVNGWLSNQVQVIGRVPMFYYLVHIYLIHLAAMLAAEVTAGYDWSHMVLTNWVSFEPRLRGFGYSLATTYLVWIGLVLILYFICRWYDRYKRSHKHWWLSYL